METEPIINFVRAITDFLRKQILIRQISAEKLHEPSDRKCVRRRFACAIARTVEHADIVPGHHAVDHLKAESVGTCAKRAAGEGHPQESSRPTAANCLT